MTGNPGVGKSMFYRYCVWRATQGIDHLPSARFVANAGDEFQRYNSVTKSFTSLSADQLRELKKCANVVRFVDGKSTELVGWCGVTILFASLGPDFVQDFRNEGAAFIVPHWSLDDLETFNQPLDADARLTNEVLLDRWHKFGGVPKFVFGRRGVDQHFAALIDDTIAENDASRVLWHGNRRQLLKSTYSMHFLLQMVPSTSDCHAVFRVEFSSMYVAQLVIVKAGMDDMWELVSFVKQHRDDPSNGVARRDLNVMMCHRCLVLQGGLSLRLQLLTDTDDLELSIPSGLATVDFDSFGDVMLPPTQLTYYRRRPSVLSSIDALFVDDQRVCYCLQFALETVREVAQEDFDRVIEGVRPSAVKVVVVTSSVKAAALCGEPLVAVRRDDFISFSEYVCGVEAFSADPIPFPRMSCER